MPVSFSSVQIAASSDNRAHLMHHQRDTLSNTVTLGTNQTHGMWPCIDRHMNPNAICPEGNERRLSCQDTTHDLDDGRTSQAHKCTNVSKGVWKRVIDGSGTVTYNSMGVVTSPFQILRHESFSARYAVRNVLNNDVRSYTCVAWVSPGHDG